MIKTASIIKDEQGQGMAEYAIACGAVVLGMVTINSLIIPPLNDLYELMANMICIPFP